MPRKVLRADQWERIEGFLSGKPTDCGVTARNNRLFVKAVLWIIRTRSPWRDLPSDFGHWRRVYVRYNRWSKKGIWERVFKLIHNSASTQRPRLHTKFSLIFLSNKQSTATTRFK